MPIVLSAILGDAGGGAPGANSLLRPLVAAAHKSRVQYRPGEDFLLHVQILTSGSLVRHRRSGIQLGNINRKDRSLMLRIYLSDEVTTRDQTAQYLVSALTAAAGLVHGRLRRRAPDWPADEIAAELAALATVL